MKLQFLSRGSRPGFTLIELLLVIGIIAILASIVIVAINPTKQLGDARNAQRRSDVNTILNAVYQYAIDNNGDLPGCLETAVTGSGYDVCVVDPGTCGAGYCDLTILTGSYLVSIPTDPAYTSGDDSFYDVSKDVNGRITISAPRATEDGESAAISVQR